MSLTFWNRNPQKQRTECHILLGQSNANNNMCAALEAASGIETFNKYYGGNSITNWYYQNKLRTNYHTDTEYIYTLLDDYWCSKIIWFQGEADMFSADNSSNWSSRFMSMLGFLRAFFPEAPAEVIICEIWRDTAVPDYITWMNVVRAAQEALGINYDYITTYDTISYDRIDDVHLSSTGQADLAAAIFP